MIPDPSWLCLGLVIANVCWPLTDKPAVTASDAATFCQIAKPLRWSRADTAESILSMDLHNRKGKLLCGWKS